MVSSARPSETPPSGRHRRSTLTTEVMWLWPLSARAGEAWARRIGDTPVTQHCPEVVSQTRMAATGCFTIKWPAQGSCASSPHCLPELLWDDCENVIRCAAVRCSLCGSHQQRGIYPNGNLKRKGSLAHIQCRPPRPGRKKRPSGDPGGALLGRRLTAAGLREPVTGLRSSAPLRRGPGRADVAACVSLAVQGGVSRCRVPLAHRRLVIA